MNFNNLSTNTSTPLFYDSANNFTSHLFDCDLYLPNSRQRMIPENLIYDYSVQAWLYRSIGLNSSPIDNHTNSEHQADIFLDFQPGTILDDCDEINPHHHNSSEIISPTDDIEEEK